MLSRLFNWVPVLFGLKFAGVASVATVQDVVASETNAPMTTSELTDVHKISDTNSSGRVASGSAVTRLMASTSVTSQRDESFVFSQSISANAEQDEAPARAGGRFVARPIAVAPPRPKARLAATKAVRKGVVRSQPGQVKQENRPTARAKLKVEGKKVAKRVVWISGRHAALDMGANVIPFPSPVNASATETRRAA